MLTIQRKVTRTDIDGVLTLLALLADKDGCAARLKELLAASEAAAAAEQKGLAAQKEAFADNKRAAEMLEAAQQAKVEAAQKTALEDARLNAVRTELEGKAQELRAEGDRLAAWQNKMETESAGFDAKAAVLAAREAAVVKAEEAANALRAEYEARLAKFKALAQ